MKKLRSDMNNPEIQMMIDQDMKDLKNLELGIPHLFLLMEKPSETLPFAS